MVMAFSSGPVAPLEGPESGDDGDDDEDGDGDAAPVPLVPAEHAVSSSSGRGTTGTRVGRMSASVPAQMREAAMLGARMARAPSSQSSSMTRVVSSWGTMARTAGQPSARSGRA